MKLYVARNQGKTLPAFALLVLLLTGCVHDPVKPEQSIAPRVEYVMKVPPAEMMQLPQKPAKINVDDPALKQSDVSHWIDNKEDYTAQLENKLIAIAKFFVGEQQKLDEQAKKENAGK